ncbi:MAG: DUF116 domain-containing protein [Ignavibacteria bacterium]|nr:DUF116 domain-containing protein [Ignavibacteria bacterium]
MDTLENIIEVNNSGTNISVCTEISESKSVLGFVSPYSLYAKGETEKFYQDVESCTEKTIALLRARLGNDIALYLQFITTNHVERPRAREEYLHELLMIGILWKEHSSQVIRSMKASIGIAKYLYRSRKKYKKYKPYIDKVRGIFSTATLYFNGWGIQENQEMTPALFIKLVNWLEATGEYEHEVKRFKNWQVFLATLPEDYFNALYSRITVATEAVLSLAYVDLGEYLADVESYIHAHKDDFRWKEDVLLCSRPLGEYCMNILGAQIMNNAMKKEFSTRKTRVVLAPGCMREYDDTRCQAYDSGFDKLCIGCSTECRISKLVKTGWREGFTIRIIPHSSDFSTWLEQWKDSEEIGVVGVACILNLLSGGLQLREKNIASQCVFLNRVGCSRHWCAQHNSPDFSQSQLQNILKHRIVHSKTEMR